MNTDKLHPHYHGEYCDSCDAAGIETHATQETKTGPHYSYGSTLFKYGRPLFFCDECAVVWLNLSPQKGW